MDRSHPGAAPAQPSVDVQEARRVAGAQGVRKDPSADHRIARRVYRSVRFLTRPVVAGVIFNSVVMVTHIPPVVNNSVASTIAFGVPPVPLVSANASSRVTDHILRAGINYHFAYGLVVARY